jgi:major membrane immunogen (membrane-anchored lipoprotein)
MKKTTTLISAIALLAICSGTASAQSSATKMKVTKEVNVEEKNGEKVLTIATTENGKTTNEVYKGAEADAKLKELDAEKSGTSKTIVTEANGKKAMKVEKKIIKKEEIKEN